MNREYKAHLMRKKKALADENKYLDMHSRDIEQYRARNAKEHERVNKELKKMSGRKMMDSKSSKKK